MPRLEDIQQFVTTLNSLGHEPEILAQKGEPLVPVEIPEQGLSEDLKNLFEDMGPDDGGVEQQAALFPESEEPLDFSSFLENPDFADLAEPGEDAPASGVSTGEPETLEEFLIPDFNDLEEAAESPGEEAGDSVEIEPFEAEPEEAEPEEIEPFDSEADTDMPDFSLPEEFSTGEGLEFSDDDLAGMSGKNLEVYGESEEFSFEESGSGGPVPEVEEMGSEEHAPDEFSLGDFGEEFGLSDDDGFISPPGEEEAAINIPEGAPEYIAAARGGEGFGLTEEEFGRLRRNLSFLPLNIKIVVEEIIAEEKADEESQIRLVRLLVKGESVRAIAAFAGKLVGRTLPVPKGYEKRTGLDYEAEKGTFAYIFRENVLPVLRVVLAVAAGMGMLTFLGYRFVYKPVHARILFKRGYELVDQGKYRDGNALFKQAYEKWADKNWYFPYADKFAEKRQYGLAREKYEELLAQYDDYIHAKTQIRMERRKDKYFRRGILEYANFESILLENFEKAEKILRRLLDVEMYNYAGLLAYGDNYIRWADFDESRFAGKYEDARMAYAALLSRYGEKDEILFRFLELFIKTDNRDEAIRLKDYFQGNPKIKVDPERYAELGGYLLDRGPAEDVEAILFRALAVDRSVPEIHYHLARYFNKKESPGEERIALDNSLSLLGAARPVTRIRLFRLVDSFARSGELHYRRRSFIEAEKSFREGIKRYEDGVQKTLLRKNAELGRLYDRLGNIYYYQSGDLDEALAQFAKAEDSHFGDPVLYYKKGFINYTKGYFSSALGEFTRTERSYPSNRNLLFALGNANYMRNNYSAAEGFYAFLTDKLESDRRRIRNLLPDERSADRAVIFNLMKAYNNLGVVLYRMGERTGNRDYTSRALVLWTDSSEISENFSRDRETMARRDTKNLAYINMRQILNPIPNYDLQIYHPLPRDLDELF